MEKFRARRKNLRFKMNEVFVMKGGTPLRGEVVISGAKNAALGIVAGALLTDEEVIIENLPDVRDINVMLEALKAIGAKVNRIESHVVSIQANQLSMKSVDDEAIRRIRASYYFIGALLGKYHQAKVPLPGGCAIGERPIDQHIKGFTALGAEVETTEGYFVAKAEELKGENIYFDVVTVGATINLMLAAVLADGQTILENVAKEPHIVDVANFLNSMGANIRGAGTDTIRIRGVERLHGTTYAVIPDQIEAGTFMCAAAVTRGNIIPKHMESITAKLRDMGNIVYEGDEEIQVIGREKQKGTKIKTLPYPGFPTDMQPQIAVTLALAEGKSTVTESIFENRFLYVEELKKMGADITVKNRVATIEGQEKLQGATLHALDLRAGAALVLAGLAAEGITVLEDIGYIRRGYEFFEKKLVKLGAKIVLAKTEEEVEAFRREA